ncbi:MAG: catalase [Ruminococcaceae bacterium]|nr:catalase [Oscillospiraceae bacterium]
MSFHPVKHFATITHHRHKVIANCKRAGILWQGLRHDLSKYSPIEFFKGARFYAGDHSPNVEERKAKGYSEAWLHHKGRNRHHFEYWTDYCAEKRKVVPIKMPFRYLAEMFCDRVAASKIYKGKAYKNSDPIEYFEGGRENRFIHPETSDMLEKLLRMLAEEGEDKTFAYLRKMIKEKKEY